MIAHTQIDIDEQRLKCIDLRAAAGDGLANIPIIHRILLENVLRTGGGEALRFRDAILGWRPGATDPGEISFLPNRVLMHDTTCGPALVDIAGLRSALAERGGDPERLNPVLPVDVSTDHSIGVDAFGGSDALQINIAREMTRNSERYRFMKWASGALHNFRAHPPGTGIMHTLNLERLATVATTMQIEGQTWIIPDTLIGTDSHTPMINGIGVLGWGVGGLEAESVMFGMPVSLRVPDVVGVRLTRQLREGILATDLALTVTERLRRIDLADRFVEFFGAGVSSLSAGDRAVVANMTPEFGANTGYFPIDGQTLRYLRATGRPDAHVAMVEAYARSQSLWFDATAEPRYSDVIDIDLAAVETSVAGPRRPQDCIAAGRTAQALAPLLQGKPPAAGGAIADGAVAIAAITSCTNTSDPRLLVAAGLVARKACALGLKPPAWVKTSLAPGSPTAASYLKRAGLLDDLEALGFAIVGYGCTTCIGNSGALTPAIDTAMRDHGLTPVAVLSGNRNFPGRVHPNLEASFLASPPLVVAFALAGTACIDILNDPIGQTGAGRDVRLADLWPSGAEIDAALALASSAGDFGNDYDVAEASPAWAALPAATGALYPWDEKSTYIRRPPFAADSATRLGCYTAHPLLVLADDITTDHISPAGAIPPGSDAGRYLVERGCDPRDLNVFASRRGNWEVMLMGLFTNKTVRNLLGEGIPPGATIFASTGEVMPLWQAADHYRRGGQSVVIVAGERYGMGSSRDWAAKGVALLGVRAVLTSSFERIHRSNLIGMGILPLRLPPNLTPADLHLRPGDLIVIDAPVDRIQPRCKVGIRIQRASGETQNFDAEAAIETQPEIEILKSGGLLPLILQRASASP